MQRHLDRLDSERFDVAVIGGGILGAFISLEAARRGWRVALVEKGDFASGTTSGSGKVLHGGIRYLQGLRLALAREARLEQKALATMVPGLVRTLPFLVPCRRDRPREGLVLRAGALAWNAFRSLVREGVELPSSRYLGESETALLTEGLRQDFVGGMLFHDVQLRSPERLCFEVLRAASERGAVIANYTEAVGLRVASGRAAGIEARDHVGGKEIEVDAGHVVNAAGAWAPQIADGMDASFPDVALGKGIHVVLDRPEPPAALALPHLGRHGDDSGSDGERRIFVMPWEGCTLVGASYAPFHGEADAAGVSGLEVRRFLAELNARWPGLELAGSRVLHAYSGLYPVFGQRDVPAHRFAASLRPLVLEHGETGGPEGLLSVMAVKFSTARRLARRVVDSLVADPSRSSGPEASRSDVAPVPPNTRFTGAESGRADAMGDPAALPDVTRRATEEEMARSLSDVLFRRSWIGHKGHPGSDRLRQAADVMSGLLDWSESERDGEVSKVEAVYEDWGHEGGS